MTVAESKFIFIFIKDRRIIICSQSSCITFIFMKENFYRISSAIYNAENNYGWMDFNFSSGNLSMNGKLFSNVKKILKVDLF